MIGDAVVEGDFIVYQFEKQTRKLLKKKARWRDDLPDQITPLISREQAEAMVQGSVKFSQLLIISPESVEFPIKPAPTNPCWMVISQDNGRRISTVIDALEGKILGYGVPPPYEAYSLGGPDHGACAEYYWDPWALNAGNWFSIMGYDTQISDRPTEATVQSHIDSDTTALFYELAHGGSYNFLNLNTDCGLPTFAAHRILASEVETWIAGRTKMRFAFIGSCEGLCHTDDGSFSYEFRKGTSTNTVTVGYCHMDWTGDTGAGQTYQCDGTCWGTNVYNWQEDLFDYLNQGWTAQAAFNQACADNPQCGAGTTCVRFAGDPNFSLVPKVSRGNLPIANAGPDQTVEQTSLAGTLVTLDGSGSYDVDGQSLTYVWTWAGGSASGDSVSVFFPLGTVEITLTVTDEAEDSAADTVLVTVRDTTPPVLIVPDDVKVEQTIAAGTPVALPPATATDICDAAPVITSTGEMPVYPLGTTTVTFTATDASGNSSSGTTKVTVVDTTPPTISVTVSPDTLWPANHKMVDITATVTVNDICDANPQIVLRSITSDEPDDASGVGDGETKDDIQGAVPGTSDYRFKLRAERDGRYDGRVYTITYQVTDASGNSAMTSATVLVPHDR